MARSNCWRIVCSMRSTWNCSISYTKRIYSWQTGDVSPRRRNVSSWNDPSSLGNSRPPCNGMRNCSVNAQKLSKESPYTLSPPISIPLPRISVASDAASGRRRAHSMRLLDMKITGGIPALYARRLPLTRLLLFYSHLAQRFQ